jgi:small-conductance mechanosensitive channel
MTSRERKIFASFASLFVLVLIAAVITRDWSNYREQLHKLRAASKHAQAAVDTRPLETAQQLAQMAVTPMEQEYAQDALRLGDHSVDLAFAAALRDAAENPAPLTPQTRDLLERIKSAEAAVAADQGRVVQFAQLLGRAEPDAKAGLQQLVAIAQAQFALDQDDLDDANQELSRAGGNRQAQIQQLFDQHKTAEASIAGFVANAAAAPSVERSQASTIVAEYRAWASLRAKAFLLAQARQEALSRASALADARAELQKLVDEEQAQKKILYPRAALDSTSGAPGGATSAEPPEQPSSLDFLRHVTEERNDLAQFDKRIQTEQQLAAVYANWIIFVRARQQAFMHRFFVSLCWILLVALLVLLANYSVQRFFARFALERRKLHTLRALILFAVQALGLLLILLVIFGMPGNFATVLALVGAGLTVALKDFIVGFFGWFVLMGNDGIRPGDWVEIEGVGGEVLKVGLLHTVLLETGNWTDPGHPTGRKVSFVNSFAIEGHYFNFSTAGQWLWDEIQVQIPETLEPYATAEAIRKIATDETAENARLAESEWTRATLSYAKRPFTATPSLSVRPTGAGVNVVLRYITRASERYEVRARLYRAIVELLHKKSFAEPTGSTPPPQSISGRA